jgi:hypothetical protein
VDIQTTVDVDITKMHSLMNQMNTILGEQSIKIENRKKVGKQRSLMTQTIDEEDDAQDFEGNRDIEHMVK